MCGGLFFTIFLSALILDVQNVNFKCIQILFYLHQDLFNPNKDVRTLSLKVDQDIGFSSSNEATLGELFLGFLNYYANIFS